MMSIEVHYIFLFKHYYDSVISIGRERLAAWYAALKAYLITNIFFAGVYILSSNLKNFPPPLIFQLDFLPQERKEIKVLFVKFCGEGGFPP